MKLRQQVVDINSRIQFAAREIVTANLEFQSVMKQRKNVNLTIEHLESGMIKIKFLQCLRLSRLNVLNV